MTKIRRVIKYDGASGECREYHEIEAKSAWGNPNKVKIDVSPDTFRKIAEAFGKSGLHKIPDIKTTRAKKDYFHNESVRDEMQVGVQYLLGYNRYGDFLSFDSDGKNIMPVRCKAALKRMPTWTKRQRDKKSQKHREFISMFYMDRVVLHSSGEVSYLGRAYVDP